jgi:hypothetical protein
MVRRRRLPLRLVALEDRAVPATFVVTSIGDSAAAAPGTLRWAINQANAFTDADTIEFNITPGGAQTILLANQLPLPAITSPVTITGATQPGFTGAPLIFIDGSNTGPIASGLQLLDHTGSVIRGLAIGNFGAAGIVTDAGAVKAGVNTIVGNYLGLGPDENVRSNTNGIVVRNGRTTIGGSAAADRNVLSGNSEAGVLVQAGNAVTIVGNRVGTNAAGTAVKANLVGIDVGSATVTIGGSSAGQGNQVAGNVDSGIRLNANARTTIRGNLIGPDSAGKPGVGNKHGIRTFGSPTPPTPNTIGGTGAGDANTISFNTGAGVAVTQGFNGVTITRNVITGNGTLGIDLSAGSNPDGVPGPDVPGGNGAGGNGQQGPPTLTAATNNGSVTKIDGNLSGQPSTTYVLEFFANKSANAQDRGEGELFLGQTSVQLAANGGGVFTTTLATGALPAGLFISATATSADGNTSEFALNRVLAVAPINPRFTGRVFVDTNVNGVQDPGEPGQSGALVFVDLNNNGVRDANEPSSTTDTAGNYTITLDAPGTYALGVDFIPAGFVPVTQTPPNPVTVIDGEIKSVNIGIRVPAGTFSGVVFFDINGNGIQDAGEPGEAGVQVFADSLVANGQFDPGEPATTTDATGAFSLNVFQDGSYPIRITAPAGFAQTTANPPDKTVAGGSTQPGYLFGVKADTIAVILGTVFNDANGNGQPDAGEGLAGVKVFVDVNDNGVCDPSENCVESDADGRYRLLVPAGSQRVRQEAKAGFTADPPPANVVIAVGEVETLNFRNVATLGSDTGTLTGTVFNDANGNGQPDAGEGLAGVTVFIDANGNNTLDTGEASTLTNAGGVYSFSLPVGSAVVCQVTPAGFTSVLNPPCQDVTITLNQTTTANFANKAATNPARLFAVGADAGGGPHVKIYDAAGNLTREFYAYAASFTGGVRVAMADFDNDGTLDVVTAPGAGGGPHVRIFSGATGLVLGEFFAYAASFAGGVFVAAGDVNNDGRPDIITGAGAGGGPHVRAFSGADLAGGTVLTEFYAYAASFTGGVTVAAGRVNNDANADIITGAGPGGGPHVRVFSGASPATELLGFFAYAPTFNGGVTVAAGDLDNDGRAEIITGAARDGGPHVKAFSSTGGEVASFFAFPAAFGNGVRVAARDLTGDGRAELLVGTGPGRPADDDDSSLLRTFSPTGTQLGELTPFPGFLGGVFVG